MKKYLLIFAAIIAIGVLFYSFKPAGAGKQIMTIRVTNRLGNLYFDDEIWISKPGETAKKLADLQNAKSKNNEKNMTTTTNILNQQVSDGWELFNVTSLGGDGSTIYT